MPNVEIDAHEVKEFASELGKVPTKVVTGVRPAVVKAGVNMKNQLREEMAASKHFKAANSISFDEGDGGMAVEVGPTKSGAGNLANIAYFGGANGGGGTVPDPRGALEAEAQRFEKALTDLVGEILG